MPGTQNHLRLATTYAKLALLLDPPQSGDPADWLAKSAELKPSTSHTSHHCLERWASWWPTSGSGPLASAACVSAYVRGIEAEGKKPGTIMMEVESISRFLRHAGWPDPETETRIRLIRHAQSDYMHAQRRAPPSAKPLGWVEVKRMLECADPTDLVELRDMAILLVMYESMARPEQVLGHKHRREWHVPPIGPEAIVRNADGSGTLKFRPAFGSTNDQAYLSPLTMTWLTRWMEVRPPLPALFTNLRNGPCAPSGWRRSIAPLGERAGVPADRLNFLSIRVGMARDLLSAGTHFDDIRRVGGWKSERSVIRLLDLPRRDNPIEYWAKTREAPRKNLASARPRRKRSWQTHVGKSPQRD